MDDPVKSEPNLVTRGRSHWPIGAVFLALLGLTWSQASSAQNLLLGPLARRVKAKIELDPRLPTGPIRYRSLALPERKPKACSLQLPVCVAFTQEVEPWAPQALAALERAYRRLVYGAGLPRPLTDDRTLLWSLEPGSQSLSSELVSELGAPFEQAGLVCRSGVTTTPDDPASRSGHGATKAAKAANATANAEANTITTSKATNATANAATNTITTSKATNAATATQNTELERAAWLCVAESIAVRLDAAEGAAARRAYAEAVLLRLAEPNTIWDDEERSRAARAIAITQRSLVGRDDASPPMATALFFEYLENTLGTATPAGLLTGLYAISSQPRKPETSRFVNEPDWLDALRESMGESQVEFANRINAFASARAQLGKPTGPLQNYAWLGQLAPLTYDWVLPVSTLPRRVASVRPIEPLGFVAVRIDIDVPAKDLTLALRVEWESPVPFTWTVVKIDAEGREQGRLDFAFEPRVSFAEKHITALDETRSLLVLGTNLGGIDATHLLDPDHAPFEPHGCTVYAVRM